MAERLPPQNIEAEMSVLGGIMLDPDALSTVTAEIETTDFYRQAHREIYSALALMHSQDIPIDLISIVSHLKASGKLEEVGGASYVATLADYVPTSTNIAYYCRLVKKAAVARRIIATANEIAIAAHDTDNPDNVLSDAYAKFTEVSKSSIRDIPFKTMRQLADEYEQYVQVVDKKRFLTGFADIDAIIRGVGPGEVMYILGGPGLFKSSLAHNIFIRACSRVPDKWFPYYSLEMSSTRMFERTIQIGLGQYTNNIESGFHHHHGYKDKVLGQLSEKGIDKLLICDHGGLTIDQIEHYTRLARHRFGEIGAICIDLLGLTTAPGTKGLFELIEANAAAIMNMAKRLQLPVIPLAHIKRLAPGEEITMESGKGSGAIEQYARFMLGLWKDKNKDIICSILKNSNGDADIKFRVDIKRDFLQFNKFEPYNDFSAKNVEARRSRVRRVNTDLPEF